LRIVFFLLPEAFCGLKHAENAAGAPPRTPLGELTTLPRPVNRLGRDTPPHTRPNSAPLARRCSRLRRLDRRATDTKSWRRHWSPPLFKVKLLLCHRGLKSTYKYSSRLNKFNNRYKILRIKNVFQKLLSFTVIGRETLEITR